MVGDASRLGRWTAVAAVLVCGIGLAALPSRTATSVARVLAASVDWRVRRGVPASRRESAGSVQRKKEAIMSPEGMDPITFHAAFTTKLREPSLDQLIRRFNGALHGTNGDTDSAMAAVNEVLATPITYETLMGRLKRAA